MRWLLIILVVLFIGLQTRLWFGEGSFAHKSELDQQLQVQRQKNQQLQLRNQRIAEEVKSLKNNLGSIEEKAREDLGMIKQGETFYFVIDDNDSLLKHD